MSLVVSLFAFALAASGSVAAPLPVAVPAVRDSAAANASVPILQSGRANESDPARAGWRTLRREDAGILVEFD